MLILAFVLLCLAQYMLVRTDDVIDKSHSEAAAVKSGLSPEGQSISRPGKGQDLVDVSTRPPAQMDETQHQPQEEPLTRTTLAQPTWKFFSNSGVIRTSTFGKAYAQEAVTEYSDGVASAILEHGKILEAHGEFSVQCVSCRTELCLVRIRAVSEEARSAALSGEKSAVLRALTQLTYRQKNFKSVPHPAFTILPTSNISQKEDSFSDDVLIEHYVKLASVNISIRRPENDTGSSERMTCQ